MFVTPKEEKALEALEEAIKRAIPRRKIGDRR